MQYQKIPMVSAKDSDKWYWILVGIAIIIVAIIIIWKILDWQKKKQESKRKQDEN